MLFNLLLSPDGEVPTDEPLARRRRALEAFGENAALPGKLMITSATQNIDQAREWLTGMSGTDGVVAKRLDRRYESGGAGDGQDQADAHGRLRGWRLSL